MLVDRANLEAHVAARERTRFAFNAVQFTSEGTVSSDGKRLLVVPYPDVDPDEYPECGIGPHATCPETGALVPVEVMTKVARSLPRGAGTRPILQHAAVSFTADRATFVTTDMQCDERKETKLVEGSFPAWGSVVPKGEPQGTARFNAEYLAQLLQAMVKVSKARGQETPTVTLEVFGHDVPAVARGTGELQSMLGLIMPVTLRTGEAQRAPIAVPEIAEAAPVALASIEEQAREAGDNWTEDSGGYDDEPDVKAEPAPGTGTPFKVGRNAKLDGVEVTFPRGKPADEVRDVLKTLRFRWHGSRKLWYRKDAAGTLYPLVVQRLETAGAFQLEG